MVAITMRAAKAGPKNTYIYASVKTPLGYEAVTKLLYRPQEQGQRLRNGHNRETLQSRITCKNINLAHLTVFLLAV
jgi:hypothetical protein